MNEFWEAQVKLKWGEPKPTYDVVVIGGGGHGLSTAYHLATRHGIRNVAVLEKSWLGGGNSGRNTQVSRSNYFYPESGAFYERSLKLFEGLAEDVGGSCQSPLVLEGISDEVTATISFWPTIGGCCETNRAVVAASSGALCRSNHSPNDPPSQYSQAMKQASLASLAS